MIKIGINGFGRIGRMAFRASLARSDVQVVAVNDLLSAEQLAYLLKYDSVHGRLAQPVVVENGHLRVGDRLIRVSNARVPAETPWRDAGVDLVIESTGIFLTTEKAQGHLQAGARRVILSAPAKDDTPVFVYGVNHERYQGETVISAASCTTNCLALIAKVVDAEFGLKRGLMTTVHAVTASQKTVDGVSGKDWRFGRGILDNIIPATTGAAKAVTKVLPALKGKLTGMSFRVPVPDVSVVDLTCELEKPASYADICAAMKRASEGPLRGILGYTDEDVVSTDLRDEGCTAIFDAKAGIQLDPTFVKLIAWYDNEWGYASKLLDLAAVR
ncbi:type I glyceraldehyde-3-phosphate dehydrogenase [Opitutus sp. ER46]|uniref:type I glyceraldehyde-3-phosphate dehydrogenase n=1 Tax=Opitutus sp. ER46 TaxID=2161864 RepID=UPI000D305024|nr:type I glyceraldehyde-3-phosphate dehydrogenase [Opitutus sp. ER46]PTX98657.1 type I glyceraldehyde-3-phosphate dehydrogenase [Opitutus sp. ER46]